MVCNVKPTSESPDEMWTAVEGFERDVVSLGGSGVFLLLTGVEKLRNRHREYRFYFILARDQLAQLQLGNERDHRRHCAK